MIKNNKWKAIISSVIILLPIIAGLILWNELPDKMPTHWNIQGEVDSYGSKAFVVFFFPLFLFFMHWICLLFSSLDKKNNGQNKKALGLVLWICPTISFFIAFVSYAEALGFEFDIIKILIPLFSLMFIAIGNYMPKTKQNYTMGIRVPWTLADEETWNATHRLCGKVWVIGGLLILPCIFLPTLIAAVLLFILIFTITLIKFQ